ncbi:uncharacterized protein LOC131008985 [Salvia miltiorrhiza]|uniref:uncharacterized protein LOC131008985 n=1 Tax=Salvia miltiorrhiza TaxID=226208 RepID=UPI0025AB656C|nr:uncharacterized protein LOC131008985 [Salvia miltiorrhiza]
MGESDESVFWNGREEDYAAFFTSHDFQTNQTPHQTIYDHNQEGDEESSSHSHSQPQSQSTQSPLGLTLRKTPSFLSLLQRSLSHGSPGRKPDESGSAAEKLKASNFPAVFIKIGSWERATRHEGDLTAKLYYAKRKLVWEVLDGALKSKIEMQWSDISAIRAATPDNLPATLEIELKQPPLFYREINPQPRKHTLWQQASDFTGGQAPIWRRHYVTFPPGVIDKHYEKLLQCDPRLAALSQKPFPSQNSPYFDPAMLGISQLSLVFNNYQYQYPYPYPYPNSAPPPTPASAHHHHSNYEDAHHYVNVDAADFNPNFNAQQHQLLPQHYYSYNNEQHFGNDNNYSLPPYFLPGNHPAADDDMFL